ncbi:FAD-binding and (Fe-S)-binding domain-containing protein [Helicobacter sp. 23-1046]
MKPNYTTFISKAKSICDGRVWDSHLMRYALGVDASCYSFVPKVVIRANSEDEIVRLLALARQCHTPITFRAAGTSLSGQCSSDSVLIIANEGFKSIEVNGNVIECGCGVIGCEANVALAPLGKKIGPDPATITTALIGGIFNNNSSGMCCGVEQNSYNTIHSVRAVLTDGTIIDTADKNSVESFCKTHAHIVKSLQKLRAEILADKELTALIARKYKIKNTTGYSINALADFSDIADILNHILIGSEGTLAFISKVRYNAVIDAKFKACGLLFFADLSEASKAVVALSKLGRDKVVSAEMMDYACLMAVKDSEGIPSIVKECKEGYSCILFQSESQEPSKLEANLTAIKAELESIKMPFEPLYSKDSHEYDAWWKIRKGILPIVAGTRPKGTTIITEDVCFEIDKFTDGVAWLQELFKKYGFDGVIFGHALAGNLHFNITPDLKDKKQYENFAALVEEMSSKVALMGGSAKAEHGTGRMVAPFVEIEWGKKAYAINVAIKNAFDEKRLLNPDVIISDDATIFKKNLKSAPKNLLNLPENSEMINRCMECGFCEKNCPSREIALTPRERIAVLREITRLLEDGKKYEADALLSEYEYFGNETCATCSSCLALCPLGIDTANVAFELRVAMSGKTQKIAQKIYNNFSAILGVARGGLRIYRVASVIFGEFWISKITGALHKLSANLPFTPPFMPRANGYTLTNKGENLPDKVVYFTSCMNRIFAPNAKQRDKRPLQEVVESICAKAKIGVIYPQKIKQMCCGKMFEDYESIKAQNMAFLESELQKATEDGKYAIITDHSSCFYSTIAQFRDRYKVYDISEFILSISDKLAWSKVDSPLLVHRLCLLKKLGKDSAIVEVAKLCSNDVRVVKSFECCGFAGKKGFFTPELNKSSTAHLADESATNIIGVSSSSTCEIGLCAYSESRFQSVAYMVDKATSAK